jgi:hypothetical protein|nr:MAG TPA: hypothetical protein [Caudoviricetes sp.]
MKGEYINLSEDKMGRFIDLTGKRFGRLIVICEAPKRRAENGRSQIKTPKRLINSFK